MGPDTTRRLRLYLATDVDAGKFEHPAEARARVPDDQAGFSGQGTGGRGDDLSAAAIHETGAFHVQDEPPGVLPQEQPQALGKERLSHQVKLAIDEDRGGRRAGDHLDRYLPGPDRRFGVLAV
jgi:hypothetical protein